MLLTRTQSAALRSAVEAHAVGQSTGLEMLRQLLNVEEDLRRQIKTQAATLTEVELLRQRLLLPQVQRAIEDLAPRFSGQLRQVRRSVAFEHANALQAAILEDSTTGVIFQPGATPALPLTQVQALVERAYGPVRAKRTTEVWVRKWLRGWGGGVNSAVTKGLIRGDSMDTVNRFIREAMEDNFAITRAQGMTLARTAVLDASQGAQREVQEANEELFISYTYLATLDSRTCPVCGPWDGVTSADRDSLPQPLRHPNCRCVIVGNTELAAEAGAPQRQTVFEEEAKKTKHRDGSTTTRFKKLDVGRTGLNYEQFFTQQPAAWQRAVLGPGRYDLWRSGRVSLGDMSRNDNLLTLKQLRTSARSSGRKTSMVAPVSSRPPMIKSSERVDPPRGAFTKIGKKDG